MPSDCVFCSLQDDPRHVIAFNDRFYAVFDIHPVSEGHSLIIAKRHMNSFFDLNASEEKSFFELIRKVKKLLDEQFKPDAYNIGVNDGEAAGQLIQHFHVHLIPRKTGDYKGSIESWKKGSPSRGTGKSD